MRRAAQCSGWMLEFSKAPIFWLQELLWPGKKKNDTSFNGNKKAAFPFPRLIPILKRERGTEVWKKGREPWSLSCQVEAR